jgi:hypothetical protein
MGWDGIKWDVMKCKSFILNYKAFINLVLRCTTMYTYNSDVSFIILHVTMLDIKKRVHYGINILEYICTSTDKKSVVTLSTLYTCNYRYTLELIIKGVWPNPA